MGRILHRTFRRDTRSARAGTPTHVGEVRRNARDHVARFDARRGSRAGHEHGHALAGDNGRTDRQRAGRRDRRRDADARAHRVGEGPPQQRKRGAPSEWASLPAPALVSPPWGARPCPRRSYDHFVTEHVSGHRRLHRELARERRSDAREQMTRRTPMNEMANVEKRSGHRAIKLSRQIAGLESRPWRAGISPGPRGIR